MEAEEARRQQLLEEEMQPKAAKARNFRFTGRSVPKAAMLSCKQHGRALTPLRHLYRNARII